MLEEIKRKESEMQEKLVLAKQSAEQSVFAAQNEIHQRLTTLAQEVRVQEQKIIVESKVNADKKAEEMLSEAKKKAATVTLPESTVSPIVEKLYQSIFTS